MSWPAPLTSSPIDGCGSPSNAGVATRAAVPAVGWVTNALNKIRPTTLLSGDGIAKIGAVIPPTAPSTLACENA
jgi:hypothetical protein